MNVIERTTEAVRRADRIFEGEGGSSRHYVRDCLLPMLAECGLEVRLATDPGAVSAERERITALIERAIHHETRPTYRRAYREIAELVRYGGR